MVGRKRNRMEAMSAALAKAGYNKAQMEFGSAAMKYFKAGNLGELYTYLIVRLRWRLGQPLS
jgi:hypothetical protein